MSLIRMLIESPSIAVQLKRNISPPKSIKLAAQEMEEIYLKIQRNESKS